MTKDEVKVTNEEERLAEAVGLLEGCREFSALMPEVRVNVAFAPERAAGPQDVLGIDGRITVVDGMPKASGPIRSGVSDHMARLVLEARRHDPEVSAGMNFRWNEAIHAFVEQYCRQRGITVGCIDRAQEPKDLIGRDKGSIPWKVRQLVAAHSGRVPRVCYETRGWGKEPLYFLLGQDPVEVVEFACAIARGFAAT
jgi:predicted fused transcriptional regulator/phosphomethylpyrimidine kinase